MDSPHFIGENDFNVFLPDLLFSESSKDDHNSRKIVGIMSSEREDRQGESVIARGLDFSDFLKSGHFNDNHSQSTSAIVGYPENVKFHDDLGLLKSDLSGSPGWTCNGYVLKGTKRADDIWELAKALENIPDKKLGFSIEGKVIRRSDKRIEKARIRNIAITNCPVNTDATWGLLTKSFIDEDIAMKAMSAGYASSVATQSGGGALRTEDLDSDVKEIYSKKKKKLKKALEDVLGFDGLIKAMEYAIFQRPDFSDEAAAMFAKQLIIHEQRF